MRVYQPLPALGLDPPRIPRIARQARISFYLPRILTERPIVFRFSMVGLLLALLLVSGCDRATPVSVSQMLSGRTMGTTYTITIVPQAGMSALPDIAREIESELAEVNQQMSTYLPTSELSKFNSLNSTDWFAVSPDTAAVVQTSLAISEQTGGAFDITVGPLVNLWGFGPDGRPKDPPSTEQIDENLARTGYTKLMVRDSPPALRKSLADLYVDLSAIAKGHGVDRVAGVLDALGLANYFIEIGGEVRTKGTRHDGQPWRVGIELPVSNQREVLRVVSLSNGSLATSGSYRNFFEMDGQRISHTIDPTTGFPVKNTLVSASVVADTCEFADAIATAMMCLGSEAGLELANTKQWAVLLVVPTTDGFETLASDKFSDLYPEAAEPQDEEL